MKQGRWSEALADLRESMRVNPRSHQAFGNIGTCLIQLGRIREARESLEKALKLDPEYEPAKENLRLLEGVDEDNPPPPSRRMKIYNDGRLD
jgi:tetratricopeptide (TPR) repeat protein